MKALIIDEPWISKILSGEKTWEMRKSNCNVRGRIALVRKGSGHVVGIANSMGSGPAMISLADYAAAQIFHGIPPERQEQAFRDGWRTPWNLQDARRLKKPVPYRHPSGAVIWVNLDPSVAALVEAQI